MKIKELNPQKNPRLPDEADSEVWQEAVKGVRKIKNPNLDLSKPAPKEFIIRENVNVFEAYGGEDLSFLIPGAADNIDANTMRRFKRGEFAIEAVLDLHGCTSEESFGKVENFIKKAYLRQKRCVQIVTGKGLHREDDIFAARGVLRDLVPQWLNNGLLRPLILTFDYSRPEDGGEGALTILLRRRRNR